jgi:hypothetical protein
MKILAWISLAILLGTYICIPVGDPDLWWHIVVGRWILAHKAVPTADHWNMFSGTNPWRAYSWSHEVVFAWVERVLGTGGLARLQLALAVALTASLQWVMGRLARDYCAGAIIGAYTTIACYAHFSLRPQTSVWVLFAATILASDVIVERGISKIRLLALAGIGCVWANTHLTAALGVSAAFLWTLQRHAGELQVSRAALSAGSFLLGTLLTPYVGGEWVTFFEKSGHTFQFGSIDEFKPAHILQFSTAFVLLQVGLLATVYHMQGALPAPSRCALAFGMIFAGLTAVKFLPFAAISLGALMSLWWREAAATVGDSKSVDNISRGLLMLHQGFQRLSFQTIGSIAFFMGCLAAVNISARVRVPIDRGLVPKEAVDFMQTHRLNAPILNEFSVGGYLMYRYSTPEGDPLVKVPIDGRTNVNSPVVWKLYDDAFAGRPNWNQYIEKVKPATILWRQGSPFVSLLELSPEWCRVFTAGDDPDDYTVFISKDEFQNRAGEFTAKDCAV